MIWREWLLVDPVMLAWAALPLGALVWRLYRGRPALHFSPYALARQHSDTASWRVRLRVLPRGLQLIALLCFVVALARPAQLDPIPPKTVGIDILVGLDTSSSMAELDMDPERTRMEVAKEAAIRFIETRSDDRIGLVTFARYPDVVCPPTLDHRALRAMLEATERVEPDGPEDATGIGTAVAKAAQILGPSEARSRVLVLLTDGEENVASRETPDEIAPSHAGQLCEKMGVRVYTIAAGIGRQNRRGEWVPVDTTQIRELAEKTEGAFFEAPDADTIDQVYRAIHELETTEFEEPRYDLKERFLPFLLIGLASMLVGRILGASVFGELP